MNLREIESLPTFALLGPGFCEGDFGLLSPLLPDVEGPLLFARFEDVAPTAYGGPLVRFSSLVADGELPGVLPVVEEAGYLAAVETIRCTIARGDVYEVNLTLRARFSEPTGASLFATLVRRGFPEFAAWLRLPDGTEIVSASPELLFRIDGRQVQSLPMKGTAPPGGADALRASDKDEAELAMITDLVRNDLSAICEPRSVWVESERRLVELSYAVQAVSDVRGRLPLGVGPAEVLAALHPGGSVTGAPKKAALDVIRALEAEPRGPYCGALAFTEGDHTTCSLLIRTAWRTGGSPWTYGTGGAIVWQSDPQSELEEVHLKLGALR